MMEHQMREERNIRQVFHLIFGWLQMLLMVAFLERRKRNGRHRGRKKVRGESGCFIFIFFNFLFYFIIILTF